MRRVFAGLAFSLGLLLGACAPTAVSSASTGGVVGYAVRAGGDASSLLDPATLSLQPGGFVRLDNPAPTPLTAPAVFLYGGPAFSVTIYRKDGAVLTCGVGSPLLQAPSGVTCKGLAGGIGITLPDLPGLTHTDLLVNSPVQSGNATAYRLGKIIYEVLH